MVADDFDCDRTVVDGFKEINKCVACDEAQSNGSGMSQSRSDGSKACSDDNQSAYLIRAQI